jgi:hypothetical protein
LTLATINVSFGVITQRFTGHAAWTFNGYGEFIEAVEVGNAEGARGYARQLTIDTILVTSPTSKNGIGIRLGSQSDGASGFNYLTTILLANEFAGGIGLAIGPCAR